MGAAGATAVWVLHGVSDVTLGLWLMHKRLLPGEFMFWYRRVVLPPFFCSLPIVWLSWWLKPSGLDSWSNAAWLGITSLFLIISTLVLMNNQFLDIANIFNRKK